MTREGKLMKKAKAEPSDGRRRIDPQGRWARIVMTDISTALRDVTASSHRGLAFLLAFGICWILCGVAACWLTPRRAALVVLCQGTIGLPLAFLLQRWLGFPPADPSNPLTPLAIYLATSQLVALPAVFFVYRHMPAHVPAVFASILGAHFLPYVWLQQSRVYFGLAIAVSVGPWIVSAVFRDRGYRAVPVFVGLTLLVAAAAL